MKKVMCLLIMLSLIILSITGCFGDSDAEYCIANGCSREALDDCNYCAEHNIAEPDTSDYEESKSTYYESNDEDNLNEIVKTGEDGYRHFNMSEREFVNTYNKLTSLKIQENNFETMSRSEYMKNMGENDPLLQRIPNIHMFYSYVSTRPYSIGVWCDSKDNILCATVSCLGNFNINSEDEENEFLARCIFVYAALTGEGNDTAQQVVVEAYDAAMSGSGISNDLYETYFSGTPDAPIFGVRVVNN